MGLEYPGGFGQAQRGEGLMHGNMMKVGDMSMFRNLKEEDQSRLSLDQIPNITQQDYDRHHAAGPPSHSKFLDFTNDGLTQNDADQPAVQILEEDSNNGSSICKDEEVSLMFKGKMN